MNSFERDIQRAYDERAATYDNDSANAEFHIRLSQDFAKWADGALTTSQKSPLKLLDLCCGTGMVSFAALDKFGPTSIIHGVDFSAASLDLARKKIAQRSDASHVEFYEGSVTDLSAFPFEKASYSLITCCSAVVLLQGDLVEILRMWSSYLADDGVLLIDVPRPGTQRGVDIASKVLEPYGVPIVHRDWIASESAVREVLEKAGFSCDSVFTTEDVYRTTVTHASEAGSLFDGLMKSPVYNVEKLTDEDLAKAREHFVELFKQSSNEEGVHRDDSRFIIGIARKSG